MLALLDPHLDDVHRDEFMSLLSALWDRDTVQKKLPKPPYPAQVHSVSKK